MKIRKIQIKKYKIFEDFEIDFTENDKAQNLIVLAGINGSGKTTLLRDVIFEFINKTFFKEDFIFFIEGNNINGEFIRELEISKKENSSKSSNLTSDRINKHFKFPNIYFHEIRKQNNIQAKETILNYINNCIYEKDKKASEAYWEVQKIIDLLFSDFNIKIDFRGVNQDKEILFKNNSNVQIKIEDLSSGEQELITKAFTLYLADIKNSIILIDEPEGSMHPNWQSRIASIYQKIADDNNNQIFLATHSPHIVASVKKEQVRILVKEEDKVKQDYLEKNDFKTYLCLSNQKNNEFKNNSINKNLNSLNLSSLDPLFEDAARIMVSTQQGSTSMLQRRMKLGYNRAGRIIDQLEAAGILGPLEGTKREVKIKTEEELEKIIKTF